MSISRDQVSHIARLARLALSEAETASLGHDLAEILAYVRKLDALDAGGAATRTEDALPGAGGATPFRADLVTASLPVSVALGLSQDHDGDFFRVPPVIEREDA